MSKDDIVAKAAESTDGMTADSARFRALSGGEDLAAPKQRGQDGFFASQSIRMHARPGRGGLAARLAVPVVCAMLAGLIVFSCVVRERVVRIQLDVLKADASSSSLITSVFGRLLISNKQRFLAENPEYLHQAEWKAGDHWLVKNGFVSPDDWVAATGFQLDEYAPASVMEEAAGATILGDMSRYLDSPRADSEIVAAYILDADDSLLASSRKSGFRFDPVALSAFPLPAEYVETGSCRVYVDYLADADPEPLVRGVARIMDYENGDRRIGSAVVIIRTNRHARELTSFLLLLAGLGLLLILFLVLACWYSARRVTLPMRRLASDMQAIAEGDFTRRAAVRESDELGLLAQAFNSMAERLRIARLNERETDRLESDLAIARDIQNNLLPPQTPRVRGLDIFSSYRPAKEIGGDYFDFLPVDESHMGLVVADASGKSIPAALVMSTTRAILRFVAPGGESAAETLTRVNAILSVDIPKGLFVTAYYVILDPLGKSMLCASAGHNPLLLARADGSVEMLNPGGIALGFDSGPIFQRSIREQRVKLATGDRVLLYTDGVVECVNAANEEYSDRRLREFLRRNSELSSHDFVGALLAELDRHRGAVDMRDDTTIVTFKVL